MLLIVGRESFFFFLSCRRSHPNPACWSEIISARPLTKRSGVSGGEFLGAAYAAAPNDAPLPHHSWSPPIKEFPRLWGTHPSGRLNLLQGFEGPRGCVKESVNSKTSVLGQENIKPGGFSTALAASLRSIHSDLSTDPVKLT